MNRFLAGIRWQQVIIAFLIGCFATTAVLHCKRKSWRHDGREHRFERMLEKFSRELDLTPEQKAKVAVIFESKRKAIEELRAEIGPRFEAVHGNAAAEIRVLLTPEQREKFDRLEAKRAEDRRRWRRDRGSPPPPPPHE